MNQPLDPRRIEVLDAASVREMPRSGPVGRLRMLETTTADGRTLMRARIRAQHPDWACEEISHEVARRLRHEPS